MSHNRINIPSVLLSMADENAYRLFQRVSAGQLPPDKLRAASSGLTRKQYYSRLSRLLTAGLITRKDGMYTVTAFGKEVLNSMKQIEQAVNDAWRFRALDSLESFEGFPADEQQKITDLLLGKGIPTVPYDHDKIPESAKK